MRWCRCRCSDRYDGGRAWSRWSASKTPTVFRSAFQFCSTTAWRSLSQRSPISWNMRLCAAARVPRKRCGPMPSISTIGSTRWSSPRSIGTRWSWRRLPPIETGCWKTAAATQTGRGMRGRRSMIVLGRSAAFIAGHVASFIKALPFYLVDVRRVRSTGFLSRPATVKAKLATVARHEKLPRPLRPDELGRLFAALSTPYRLVAEWALATGVRRKELCGLMVPQIPDVLDIDPGKCL